jgi:hypothetical protein
MFLYIISFVIKLYLIHLTNIQTSKVSGLKFSHGSKLVLLHSRLVTVVLSVAAAGSCRHKNYRLCCAPTLVSRM